MADTDFWNQEFPITSVTREDRVSAGFPKHVVEKISDSDMQEIASAMEDVYCDHGYWEDLALCTKRILERKEEDAVLSTTEHTTGDTDGLT